MSHTSRSAFGALIALSIALVGGPSVRADGPKKATLTATTDLVWQKTPIGPEASPSRGDFTSGSRVTFLKFAAGAKTPPHTHSVDYWGVVSFGKHASLGHRQAGDPEGTSFRLALVHARQRRACQRVPGRRGVCDGHHPGWEVRFPAFERPMKARFAPPSRRKEKRAMRMLLRAILCLALLRSDGIALPAPETTASPQDDAALFAIFDQVNTFDIETATLGAEKGQSRGVRALAAMVLRDHSAVRQMARDLAKTQGVQYDVPTDDEPARAHAKALAELQDRSPAPTSMAPTSSTNAGFIERPSTRSGRLSFRRSAPKGYEASSPTFFPASSTIFTPRRRRRAATGIR